MKRVPYPCVLATVLGACGPAMTASGPSSLSATTAAVESASSPPQALSPALGEAMGRVRGLLADPTDAAIHTTFSPGFLASIPPDEVKAIFAHTKAHLGTCTKDRPIQVQGETSATVRIECQRGALSANLVINPAAPYLLDYLLLKTATP